MLLEHKVGKVGLWSFGPVSSRRVQTLNMTIDEDEDSETLVKSAERVRDLGEVFTPTRIVNEMLDLLPSTTWTVHPSQTFLESSCGDGNFLVSIFDKKAEVVAKDMSEGQLEAGSTLSATQFHLLEALSSIYGVDISVENIDGGVPEHPVGARERMFRHFLIWHESITGKYLAESDPVAKSAQWIVRRNIQLGNMLEFNQDGSRSGCENLPIVEYEWHPELREVSILLTNFGDVRAEAEMAGAQAMTLFGPTPAQEIWSGPADEIFKAKIEISDYRFVSTSGGNS